MRKKIGSLDDKKAQGGKKLRGIDSIGLQLQRKLEKKRRRSKRDKGMTNG